jgi:hypothetical protein
LVTAASSFALSRYSLPWPTTGWNYPVAVGQAIVALLAAFVGAGAAIGGQALAPYLQSRRAHEQWLRDRRAERWEDLLPLLDRSTTVMWQLVITLTGEPIGEPSQEDLEREKQAIAEAEALLGPLSTALSRLIFYVSDDVAKRLRAAQNAFSSAALRPIRDPFEEDEPPPRWQYVPALQNKFFDALDELEQEMREELDIPRTRTSRWKQLLDALEADTR